MNLLAGESVDKPIVEQLRQDSHAVLYVAEMAPVISDDIVLQQANEHHDLCIQRRFSRNDSYSSQTDIGGSEAFTKT